MTAPSLSAADQGAIYFDATANKFRVSENGGAYADLVPSGAAAWTKTGAVLYPTTATDNVVVKSTLTVLGEAFSVGGSTLVAANGNIGLGTADPATRLHINGVDPILRMNNTATGHSFDIKMPNSGHMEFSASAGEVRIANGSSKATQDSQTTPGRRAITRLSLSHKPTPPGCGWWLWTGLRKADGG